MNIYFAGSIRGGRDNTEIYSQIIKHLSQYGRVLTEHVGNKKLTQSGESMSDNLIYERDMSLIKDADVIVADVSIPSLGVGYEIAKAEDMNKSVLCLHRSLDNKKLSAMIEGNQSIVLAQYATVKEATDKIDLFFKSSKR